MSKILPVLIHETKLDTKEVKQWIPRLLDRESFIICYKHNKECKMIPEWWIKNLKDRGRKELENIFFVGLLENFDTITLIDYLYATHINKRKKYPFKKLGFTHFCWFHDDSNTLIVDKLFNVGDQEILTKPKNYEKIFPKEAVINISQYYNIQEPLLFSNDEEEENLKLI